MFSKKTKRIYMDYAATTPLDSQVKREMDRFWTDDFGNPSAIYKEGVITKKVLEGSRKKTAKAINSHSDEILFTSGGTESNNLVIFGFLNSLEEQGANLADLHIITSAMEHHSVLDCFKEFEKKGMDVDYVGVGEDGIIDLNVIKELLRPNTVLVSIMYANNEIGTVQPIAKISRIIKKYSEINLGAKPPSELGGRTPKLVFHTDASQAPLYLDINVDSLGVDLMTLDGQKIYGPKGVGALYIKRGVSLKPILFGGGQEGGLRPGTENVPLIVGFAKALEIADEEREEESNRLIELRDYFIHRILKEIPGSQLNGDGVNRLPNNINISIPNIDNEFAIIQMDERGIACSAKSACLSMEGTGSHVLKSLGKDESSIRQSLRFSLGKSTTKGDIDYVIKNLIEISGK